MLSWLKTVHIGFPTLKSISSNLCARGPAWASFIPPMTLSTYTHRLATENVALVWRVFNAMGDVQKPCFLCLGAQAVHAGPVWHLEPDAPAIGVD